MSDEEEYVERMKKVVKSLDNPKWRERYGDELETVEESHDLLAQTYYEVIKGVIVGTLILLSFLVLVDVALYFQSSIYGLTINIWGTMFMIYPSLRGRYMIAGISEGVDREAIRRIETRRVVFTLSGFTLLAFGFVLQILSHQSVSGDELFTQNYLKTYLPEWTTLIFLFLGFVIVFKYYSN
jgi:hypothetical protein